VLLVDSSSAKREMRSEVMRKLGMDVDCAADIPEARSWWRADLYDLVLINMEKGLGHRDRFCEDVRSATPPQQLAFLVGKPEYLANFPDADDAPVVEMSGLSTVLNAKATVPAGVVELPQRWGILEASRRIAEVRSASVARTQAIRNQPAPLRDYEAWSAKRTTRSTSLDELLRKEMQ
jgi:CheY-like chemotaxis protein